jgi:hypothetical protein
VNVEVEPTPRRVRRGPLPAASELASQTAALVAGTLRRWYRRAIVVVGVGVLLFLGFIIAAIYLNDTRSAVNRNGQEMSGTVKAITPPPGRVATVEFRRDDLNYTVPIDLPDRAPVYAVDQVVRISVDRENPERSVIMGATKTERVTSMPVAGLFVSSLLVMGMGLFDLQAAARCRKYIAGQTWKDLRWRGVVYGPGRGRVRAAGWLSDPDNDRKYLMVNARGCWRQGVDLLAEPTDLSVAGNPVGVVAVRHPATLRVVLLRPPRGERQRERALSLIATGKG